MESNASANEAATWVASEANFAAAGDRASEAAKGAAGTSGLTAEPTGLSMGPETSGGTSAGNANAAAVTVQPKTRGAGQNPTATKNTATFETFINRSADPPPTAVAENGKKADVAWHIFAPIITAVVVILVFAIGLKGRCGNSSSRGMVAHIKSFENPLYGSNATNAGAQPPEERGSQIDKSRSTAQPQLPISNRKYSNV